MKVKISPSLICADLLNLESEIRALDSVADYYHVDICDRHYVNNLALSPCFMEEIAKITKVPLDAHLYVDNIDPEFVQYCIDCGAEVITLPLEIVEPQVDEIIRLIKDNGKKVCFFSNPDTPLDVLKPYLEKIDMITVMTVNPKTGVHEFDTAMVEKMRQAKQWKEEGGYDFEIVCDGHCSREYYKLIYDAGCDVFIMGSTGLFGKGKDTEESAKIMEAEINEEIGA